MHVRYLGILICIITMSPLTRDAQNKREREKEMMDIICY